MSAIETQSSWLGIAEAMPVLCKGSASRTQSNWLEITEAMPTLCKGSASRVQSNWLEIAEAMPTLCKGSGISEIYKNISRHFYSQQLWSRMPFTGQDSRQNPDIREPRHS